MARDLSAIKLQSLDEWTHFVIVSILLVDGFSMRQTKRKKGQRKLAALKCGLLLAKEVCLLHEDNLAVLDAEALGVAGYATIEVE